MYVGEYMNTNVITVRNDTPLFEAEKVMRDHRIRHLPVLDKGGKLVGMLTRGKIREAKPSQATSLSIWEHNYLLAKMMVKDVMEKNIITVTPETTVEEATALGEKSHIGALPVVKDKQMVGIVTATDLYKITVRALGFGQPGARLRIFECGKTGSMAEVTDIINRSGAKMLSLFRVVPPGTGREDCMIHIDREDADGIVNELKSKGYQVEKRSYWIAPVIKG